MTDTENGRVTLAIIQRDILHLTALFVDHASADIKRSDDREDRLREIEYVRIPQIENRVGRVEERQGGIAVGQGIFTTIAAVIAGWFGSRQ